MIFHDQNRHKKMYKMKKLNINQIEKLQKETDDERLKAELKKKKEILSKDKIVRKNDHTKGIPEQKF